MRYEKGHKETTRQHILDVASKQFRKGGIESVGIAGLMKDSGLTNGAFYTHFKSKEHLVREVLISAFDKQQQTFIEALKHGLTIEDAIRNYLSAKQRDHCDESCPGPSLMSEIARHSKVTRNVFTEKVQQLIDLFSNQIKESDPVKKQRKSIAIYAQLIGSLQLARVVTNKEESDLILESGIDAAIDMVNRS